MVSPNMIFSALTANGNRHLRRTRLRIKPIAITDDQFWEVTGLGPGDLGNLLPGFPPGSGSPGEMAEIARTHYQDSPEIVVERADKICGHVFDLLGSGDILIDPINWHRDFKTGYEWNPRDYYMGTYKHVTQYLSKGIRADAKVPWELSRFYHSAVLGIAYQLTGREKYAGEFVDQVTDWITNNPVGLGINWASTMDSAIRAINWIWGYIFLKNSEKFTEEFLTQFLKSLYLHGRFISSHLEKETFGNHYVADLLGTVFLGCLFSSSEEARSWRYDGMRLLEREVVRQVGEDGVQFESSIAYHRLVTETFATAMLISQGCGLPLSPEYESRLGAMMEFVLHYTKSDGLSPTIGDADDGRIQTFFERDMKDHAYLLDLGAVLLRRPGLAIHDQLDQEAFWLLGSKSIDDYNDIRKARSSEPPGEPGSRSFPGGGFYLMRKGGSYLIIRCGAPYPGAPTGHVHCDQFSFELHGRGQTFVMDPGSYVYTESAKWRNLFRSSAYHNTVTIDGGEMNHLSDRNLFVVGFRSRPRIRTWVSCDEHDFLDAEHPGYSSETETVLHRRQVYFEKNEDIWCIRDVITGSMPHRAESHLHLSPLPVNKLGNGVTIRSENEGEETQLLVMPFGEPLDGLEISSGWVSPSYGRKLEAPILTMRKGGNPPIALQTLFMFVDEDYAPGRDTTRIGEACIARMDEIIRTTTGTLEREAGSGGDDT